MLSLGLRGLSNFTKDFLLSKHLLRVGRGARETVKSIFSALPEESSLAPSTHVRRLITTCNSSSGGLDTLFWSLHSRAQNFKSNKSLKNVLLGWQGAQEVKALTSKHDNLSLVTGPHKEGGQNLQLSAVLL